MEDNISSNSGRTATPESENSGVPSAANPSLTSDRATELKAIASDSSRWNALVKGVSRKNPASPSMQDLRQKILKGFESNDWSDLKSFAQMGTLGAALSDNSQLDFGEVKARVGMWLDNSEYFEKLFSAVGGEQLSGQPDLYTDSRLVDFISTFGADM